MDTKLLTLHKQKWLNNSKELSKMLAQQQFQCMSMNMINNAGGSAGRLTVEYE